MAKTYRIGTRTSPLALRQVEEILKALRKFYPDFYPVRNNILPGSILEISNGVKAKIIGIDTYGDKDKATPISQIEGTDFFTREIDEALLTGKIDFAVHSAKDLPDKLTRGLVIAAVTEPVDPYDVLVSKSDLKLDGLPYGAKIGTSSLRRKMQLKEYRSDFEIVDIRGDIEKRLRLLDETDLDAIVIAAAGLIRLGLENRITQRIPFEIVTPHPLQGSLAIETRENDKEIIYLFNKLDMRKITCLQNVL